MRKERPSSASGSAAGLLLWLQQAAATFSKPGELRKQVLARVSLIRRESKRLLSNGRDHLNDIKSSKSPEEALEKLRALARQCPWEEVSRHAGRVLVCLYFINMMRENVELYTVGKHRLAAWEQFHPNHAPIPYNRLPHFPLSTLFLAPATLLLLIDVAPLPAAAVLLAETLYDSAALILGQTILLIVRGQRPNELMVKRLGMLGCTALVMAQASKRQDGGSGALAGVIAEAERGMQRMESRRKSAVLLAARLAVAALFLFVGLGQMGRIWHRSELPQHMMDKRDGHDNSWLVLELALSLPLAAGYKTGAAALGLASALAMESLTCWQFWSLERGDDFDHWDLHARRMHQRAHFCTNLAVAGGLLLLRCTGAGRYTVDRLLAAKKGQ